MDVRLYQVDAFTDTVFKGNPAAVCPLDRWLPDETMQAIALENNLSETAFFVARGDDFDIRWFTPMVEIDLAGHPTLATAFVILGLLDPLRQSVRFFSRIGDVLTVERDGDRLAMDFPPRVAEPVTPSAGLVEALGQAPQEVLAAERDYLVIYADEGAVRSLEPDMPALLDIDRAGVIVSAPGADCDFVSRFFAPAMGIAEDPVTGSAHCTLVPYWSRRLGKRNLHARQVSARGGELFCGHGDGRVRIAGHAALYMQGTISI